MRCELCLLRFSTAALKHLYIMHVDYTWSSADVVIGLYLNILHVYHDVLGVLQVVVLCLSGCGTALGWPMLDEEYCWVDTLVFY